MSNQAGKGDKPRAYDRIKWNNAPIWDKVGLKKEKKPETTKEGKASDSIESGVDLQRLVRLLGNVEKHLLSVYGKTVADFESDPIEEEGWMLYCEVKAERDRILKQNA